MAADISHVSPALIWTCTQVAQLVARHPEVARARVIATRVGEMDAMTVQLETDATDAAAFAKSISDVLKLKGEIELVTPGGLPRDGVVIEDKRDYDT